MDFWIEESPWGDEEESSKVLEEKAWQDLDKEVVRIYALVKHKDFTKEELEHLLSVILTHARLNGSALKKAIDKTGYGVFLDNMKKFFEEEE